MRELLNMEKKWSFSFYDTKAKSIATREFNAIDNSAYTVLWSGEKQGEVKWLISCLPENGSTTIRPQK
jgi:hypothetical protein